MSSADTSTSQPSPHVVGDSGFWLKISVILGLLTALFVGSFYVGRFNIGVKDLVTILFSPITGCEQYWDDTLGTVVLNVRLPRIILAVFAGGALSLSGASYQTLFKNPMVSPDILGVSSGAGFGAALAMLMELGWVEIQLFAFIFGTIAVGIAFFAGSMLGRRSMTILVLAGIAVSGMFQAMLSIVKYLADTESVLPSITFWLMGSLGKASLKDVGNVFPPICLSVILIYLFRHQINALSVSEEEASTLGVNVKLVKAVVVASSTILTVATVSVCGIIGWIGVITPHVARMIIGASFSRVAPASFLIGALFLLLIDNIIRGVPGAELPLGVLTALVGTPIFLMLLSRAGKGWM